MNSPSHRSLIRSSYLAAIAGTVGGTVTAIVMLLIEAVRISIWGAAIGKGLATERPLAWCLGIGISVGLLIALTQRQRPKALLPELQETLDELRQPSGLSESHSKAQLLSGALALVGGGTVGPEALMTRLVAVACHRLWKGQDRKITAAALAGSLGLFGSPFVGGAALAGRRWQLLWRWLPGTIGGIAGFLAFDGLSSLGSGLHDIPYTWPLVSQDDLPTFLSALLAGIVGSFCGAGLNQWRQWLKHLELHHRFWWWPALTGALLGIATWGLPLATSSGEQQIRPLMLGEWSLLPTVLIISGVIKLLLMGLCLETGWRGGQFFPAILASCAIGIGLHQLLPELGSIDSWCGGVVGGSLSVLLNSPLIGLILGISLLQGHGAGALLIGLLIGQLISPWRNPPQINY